jgi:hypothetical protein
LRDFFGSRTIFYPRPQNLPHPVSVFDWDGAVMAGESYWSWERSTDHYKAVLIKIIAELFALARIVPGEVPHVASGSIWDLTLPRHAYRRALALLKPAESALRRLIIMGAHGKTFVPALGNFGDVVDGARERH